MPENSITHPFTDDDKRRIDESLLEIDDAEHLIKKGRLAGLDLSEQERELKTTRDRLRKIKQVFWPNG